MHVNCIVFELNSCILFTFSGIAFFVSGQNNVETLILDGEDLTDITVKLVANNLPHLQSFQILFCNHLTDKSFEVLFGKLR